MPNLLQTAQCLDRKGLSIMQVGHGPCPRRCCPSVCEWASKVSQAGGSSPARGKNPGSHDAALHRENHFTKDTRLAIDSFVEPEYSRGASCTTKHSKWSRCVLTCNVRRSSIQQGMSKPALLGAGLASWAQQTAGAWTLMQPPELQPGSQSYERRPTRLMGCPTLRRTSRRSN